MTSMTLRLRRKAARVNSQDFKDSALLALLLLAALASHANAQGINDSKCHCNATRAGLTPTPIQSRASRAGWPVRCAPRVSAGARGAGTRLATDLGSGVGGVNTVTGQVSVCCQPPVRGLTHSIRSSPAPSAVASTTSPAPSAVASTTSPAPSAAASAVPPPASGPPSVRCFPACKPVLCSSLCCSLPLIPFHAGLKMEKDHHLDTHTVRRPDRLCPSCASPDEVHYFLESV